MRWLNNVSCLFLSFLLITSGDKCSLIKVDWLAACIAIRVVGAVLVFSSGVGNGKQGPISEEMSQTLLTNKRQGKLEYVQGNNIIKPTQTRINHEKNTVCGIKSFEQLKNLKKGPVPY